MDHKPDSLAESILMREVSLPQDEAFLKQLVFGLYSDCQEAWTLLEDTQKTALLQIQYSAQIAEYSRAYPGAENFIILNDNEAAGRLLIDRSEDELTLVDIIIHRDYRNRGLGTLVLKQLMDKCANTSMKLSLSVAKSNPAANLYHRLGMKVVNDEGSHWRMDWRADL